MAWTWIIRGTK